MKKAALKGFLFALCSVQGAHALGMKDPSQDFAFLEFEPYPKVGGTSRFEGPAVAPSADRAWRLAGQLSFPAGKAGDNQFFGSFKSTLMDRDIIYNDSVKLNDGVLERYWLSGGVVVPGAAGQSTVAMVGVGCNSDFADISLMDFNTEWIAMHSWVMGRDFSWGMGVDVQQYFHKFQPYPLIFVDWRVSDRTKLKWDADYLEAREFLTPLLCFTAGVRFNLEFFALQHDASFEYHSAGLETGFQYAVGGNCYLRLKYKELVWGREYLGLTDGSVHERDMDAGRSLRLNVAYGL